VPAVLPQVLATIDHIGRAHVSVDGIGRPEGPVERDELGKVLTSLAEQAGGPVRVEIREPDGSRYADILQPQPARPDDPPSTEESDPPSGQAVLAGDGFLPGEPVLVAVVARTVVADADGTVSLPVAPRMPRKVDELILLGTSSATIVRGTAPARSVRRWRR
jgi:hypothetical protein